MPKISELFSVPAPVNGAELLPAVQNGITYHLSAGQLASYTIGSLINAGGIPPSLMPAFTGGEVTSQAGTVRLLIDKNISPQWLGLHTFGSQAIVSPPDTNTIAQFCGVGSGIAPILVEAHGDAASLRLQRYNGGIGIAGPLPINSGDRLGRISMRGYDGASFNAGAHIHGIAFENWTTTAHGCGITFETTSSGQTAIAEKVRINSSGGMWIGPPFNDPGQGSLGVSGSVGVVGPVSCGS